LVDVLPRALRTCTAVALALLATGVLAAPKKRPRSDPAWTRFDSGPCPAPFSPKLLCAVGTVKGIATEAGRGAAETRARAALAQALQRARGSPPSTGGGDGVTGTVVSAELRGSMILATHRDRNGTWFALAAIERGADAALPPR
jgi:hypothetical protein